MPQDETAPVDFDDAEMAVLKAVKIMGGVIGRDWFRYDRHLREAFDRLVAKKYICRQNTSSRLISKTKFEDHMTSPQVSESEVEAAARPIAEAMYSDYRSSEGYNHSQCELSSAPQHTIVSWMQDARPIARAALTAAAQVRERQKEQQASLVQATTGPAETSRDHPSIEKPAAWQTLVRGRWCNLPEDWDSTENRSDQTYRPLFAHAIQPTLMPIYGATEPDSGPDVLGERKDVSDG